MKIILSGIVILVLAGLAFYVHRLNVRTEIVEPLGAEQTLDKFLNQELLKELNIKYPELRFKLNGEKIISINDITVAAKIIDHKKFDGSESFQIHFYTSHKFFKKNVEERLAGIGKSDTTALQYGIQSFLSGQFPVIVAGIDRKHSPEMDFDVVGENGKSHWHPVVGAIQLQGELFRKQDSLIYEKTYNLIKPLLVSKLKTSDQDFHWFRYYISKMKNGEITGDCYFDNEPYEEGLAVLKKFALTWETTAFAGQKQFIMLRRCQE